MDAVELLRNRVSAIGASSRTMMSEAADLDWGRPLFPGTSPLGLTFWHLPRAVDWIVNASIRGCAEVVDDPAFASLPDPEKFGFGTGLTPELAAQAAAAVRPADLISYSEAVHAATDEWMSTLSADSLDERVPEFLDRQRTRAAYSTDEALAEVTHLADLSIAMLLSRPALAHLLMHLGEIDVIMQLAR